MDISNVRFLMFFIIYQGHQLKIENGKIGKSNYTKHSLFLHLNLQIKIYLAYPIDL